MNCRTGCKTQDCRTYAECLRSARTQAAPMWTNSKTIHSELAAYAAARRQGIQPAGTQAVQVEAAVRASNDAGRAWDAGIGDFK